MPIFCTPWHLYASIVICCLWSSAIKIYNGFNYDSEHSLLDNKSYYPWVLYTNLYCEYKRGPLRSHTNVYPVCHEIYSVQIKPRSHQSKVNRPGLFWRFIASNRANLMDLMAATGLIILLKLDSNRRFFGPYDLGIWWMTSKNYRAPPLCYIKLCASFQSHWWIQTGVIVQKTSIRVNFLFFFWKLTDDLENQ